MIEDQQKKVYLAGKMRGLPKFNFPAFMSAATKLRAKGYFVFNPAERDNERHGTDISKFSRTGNEKTLVKNFGFDLRVALHDDLSFICREADAIAMIPGWEDSKGANAELATAKALGLEIIYLDESYVN
ncbi:MAG: DUF4406 domain-containing protein [Candidatus Helarchaeota archaeon]|nr:DUF4406 domain-containing protein [Candidatus Helarchaeota archaeon]